MFFNNNVINTLLTFTGAFSIKCTNGIMYKEFLIYTISILCDDYALQYNLRSIANNSNKFIFNINSYDLDVLHDLCTNLPCCGLYLQDLCVLYQQLSH